MRGPFLPCLYCTGILHSQKVSVVHNPGNAEMTKLKMVFFISPVGSFHRDIQNNIYKEAKSKLFRHLLSLLLSLVFTKYLPCIASLKQTYKRHGLTLSPSEETTAHSKQLSSNSQSIGLYFHFQS